MPNIDIQTKIKGVSGSDLKFDFDVPDYVIANEVFPDDGFKNGAISLTEISASVDRKFTFAVSGNPVGFGAGAGAAAAVGVYRSSAKLFKDLHSAGLSEKLTKLSGFKIADSDNLIAIRWGYDLKADAKASIALGSPAKISIGGSVKKTGFYAVLHSVPRSEKARSAITQALQSWRVPAQIKSEKNLHPGTTLLTESSGKLGLSLGLEYGFSYNWVKDAQKLGGLEGDIGMKINAGISGTLAYNVYGTFSIAVSRETDARKVRVRVYKSGGKTKAYGFNAGLDFQINEGITPEKFRDFIKGVFNIHESQVLKDFEEWADSDKPIEDLLGEKLHEYSKKLLGEVTGLDVDAELDKATKLLRDSVKKWHALPQDLSGVVSELIGNQAELTKFKSFVEEVVSVSGNTNKLLDLVGKEVETVDFFRTPIGKWLTLTGRESATSILANLESEKKQLVDAAKKTLAVLDGSVVESTLTNLQGAIDEKLNLDRIKDLDPDKWLKSRLSDLIGETFVAKQLEDVKKALISLEGKVDKFYEIGKKAIEAKYNFNMSAAFSSEETDSALIDLTIDYEETAAGDNSLEQALRGEFASLLTETRKGVILNTALLTHGIKRKSSIEINLPFYKFSAEHINEAITKATPEEGPDGRIWMFTVSAFDIKSRMKRFMSKLSIVTSIGAVHGRLRQFDDSDYRADYQLRIAKKNATARFVERRMELAATSYLPKRFPDREAFSAYLIGINNVVDTDNPGGLGNFMASLEVSLPGKVLSAWHDLPEFEAEKDKILYREFSKTVQAKLREWIPRGYIQDPDQFKRTGEIYPLLVYSALIPKTERIKDGLYHWRFDNKSARQKMFNENAFQFSFRRTLENTLPDISVKYKDKYAPAKLGKILNEVLNSSQMSIRFTSLCRVEYRILRGIRGTAQHYHRFQEKIAEKKLNKAKRHLSRFGSELVETFNEDLGGRYAGKSLRPLGLMLMYELAKLRDPNIPTVVPTAAFRAMVIKDDVDFEKEKFLGGVEPKKESLLLQPVPIVQPGGSE